MKRSKMENLHYKTLKVQEYFKSTGIYPDKARSIFMFRTRMSDVKLNFKSNHTNLNCPLGCEIEESQEHLLQCEYQNIEQEKINGYKNLFSNNIKRIQFVEESFSSALKNRDGILENLLC